MEVTTARILDKRRMLKKTSLYPLAIRVTFNRKPVLFPINLFLSIDNFKKLSSPRLGEELKQIRDKFKDEDDRAKRIIKNLGTFTFEAFRDEFYKDCSFRKTKRSRDEVAVVPKDHLTSPTRMLLISEGRNKKYGKRLFDRIRSNVDYQKLGPLAVAFGDYIKMLEAQERIGTSEAYFTSLMSLLKFKANLRLEDITVEFLYAFEKWMLSKENSYTTIGIYLRPLRAIINLPKNKIYSKEEYYPFGKGKYIIPTGTTIKKALDLSEIKKIYDYQAQTEHPNEMFSRDIWLFGYYSNGINPKDIAHLKYRNLDEDFIIILREKTRFTTRAKPKNIVIAINDEMRQIIRKWGNSDRSPENYIFPVLSHGLSAHRRRELVQGFTTLINDWMKRICAHIGIDKKVRTMEYRHTMATVLKRSGASPLFIQEAMGHSDLTTTETYLDSFELDIKKKFANNLMSFKDI